MPILLKNGNVINSKNCSIEKNDVLIKNKIISQIGTNMKIDQDTQVIDLKGKYIAPGFIESHMHIESTMLPPLTFAHFSVQHGTTTALVDPHEIANVAGKDGIKFFIKQAKISPMDIFIGIPSCVPATHLETSGAKIELTDIKEFLSDEQVYGLGEMMNFPGIIYDKNDARAKVDLVYNSGKIVDGHFPCKDFTDIPTYISNGKNDQKVRIMSDHESITANEAICKLKSGMFIALRYGSATKDLDRILPELLKKNIDLSKCMLCSDDLSAADLAYVGHIDRIIKRAAQIIAETKEISKEEAMLQAIQLATYNPAKYITKFLDLTNRPQQGIIKENCAANLVILENLTELKIDQVISQGKIIDHKFTYNDTFDYSHYTNSVKLKKKLIPADFEITTSRIETETMGKIIEIIPNSLITKSSRAKLKVTDNLIHADPQNDILKIAVIERHDRSSAIFTSFIKGFKLKNGALASTVAHDSHNLIVAGTSNKLMAEAANKLKEVGGGMLAYDGQEFTILPLQICGLMSTEDIETIVKKYDQLKKAAQRIGTDLENAFMTLSFMALPVIPELKITDIGLIDVNKFMFTLREE